MKTPKLSILGYIGGFIYTGCSVAKWFFISPDPSQMVSGCAVGLSVVAFAYIYSWMKRIEIGIAHNDKKIEAYSKWYSKGELR